MSSYGTLITYIIAACTANKRCSLAHTMTKDSVSVIRTADQCITLSGISGVNSYYSIPTYEWKWYVDGDLKKKYYIPCTADVLACIVNTISNYGDWVAPFGVVKGILQNTTKLYYNLEEGDGSLMSDLYKRGINPIVYREDENGNAGFFFYGNRTKYNPASDLSRINIANALLADIKKLGQLAEPFISESIDQNTFDLIVQRCDKNYLATRAVKAFDQLDGDDGYRFICDSSNNTAQTRKEKSIIMDFMVKYKSAAEYLKLRITVTSAGTDFALI
jgi:hypothetical protein